MLILSFAGRFVFLDRSRHHSVPSLWLNGFYLSTSLFPGCKCWVKLPRWSKKIPQISYAMWLGWACGFRCLVLSKACRQHCNANVQWAKGSCSGGSEAIASHCKTPEFFKVQRLWEWWGAPDRAAGRSKGVYSRHKLFGYTCPHKWHQSPLTAWGPHPGKFCSRSHAKYRHKIFWEEFGTVIMHGININHAPKDELFQCKFELKPQRDVLSW